MSLPTDPAELRRLLLQLADHLAPTSASASADGEVLAEPKEVAGNSDLRQLPAESASRRKRRRRKLPGALREHEVRTVVRASRRRVRQVSTPAKVRDAWRDLAILRLGFFLGLRVAEMCALRVDNLDLQAGVCRVENGKGGKDRTVPVPRRVLRWFRAWIGGRTTGYVLPGQGGRPMSVRTVRLRVLQIGERAGLNRRLKPHSTRHSYATALRRRGVDITEIQRLLGHSSISVTQVYVDVEPEQLRAACDRL